MQHSVGIIGGGVVGGAVKNYFRDARLYDKYKQTDPIETVGQAKFIFICVPTPYNNHSFDLSILDEAVANVTSHLEDPEQQLVVIKSTALPGTTQAYQDKYPQVNFAFNPEFLKDRTANEDFIKPYSQLVGYTTKTKDSPLIVALLEALPKAPYARVLVSGEAEMIKYAANTFLALQVIFANQIYDICQSLSIDYDGVEEAVKADKRIGKTHWEIWHTESSLESTRSEKYRGYGGKCFPKDINSLIHLGEKLGVDVLLLESARAINLRLNGGKYE